MSPLKRPGLSLAGGALLVAAASSPTLSGPLQVEPVLVDVTAPAAGVDVLANTAVDTIATVTDICSGGAPPNRLTRSCVSIGADGFDHAASRVLPGPGGALRYNLFMDAARTIKFGSWQTGYNGSGATLDVPYNGSGSLTAYARLYASQQPAATGPYSVVFAANPPHLRMKRGARRARSDRARSPAPSQCPRRWSPSATSAPRASTSAARASSPATSMRRVPSASSAATACRMRSRSTAGMRTRATRPSERCRREPRPSPMARTGIQAAFCLGAARWGSTPRAGPDQRRRSQSRAGRRAKRRPRRDRTATPSWSRSHTELNVGAVTGTMAGWRGRIRPPRDRASPPHPRPAACSVRADPALRGVNRANSKHCNDPNVPFGLGRAPESGRALAWGRARRAR